MPQTKTVFYGEDYFERGVQSGVSLYQNYSWMPELTIPMAMTIVDHLSIPRGAMVLDYGCAKGFLVKALRWLGRSAFGVDISEYAVKNADPEVKEFVGQEIPGGFHFDYVIAKDVLEHMPLEDILRFLDSLDASNIFVVVPLGDGTRYHVPAYELDKTHIVRQPLEWLDC
jgi:SAM-dependent methyltransferase